jgi:hypothetical protein
MWGASKRSDNFSMFNSNFPEKVSQGDREKKRSKFSKLQNIFHSADGDEVFFPHLLFCPISNVY